MAEQVIVRQKSNFETVVLARDPHNPDDQRFYTAEDVRELTPYGMLLAGLASCTALVINTYANHRDIDLHEVEMHLRYDRVFDEDCEQCEHIHEYRELISEKIVLNGNLTPQERQRLFQVSKHCPIHKMLLQGIEIHSELEG